MNIEKVAAQASRAIDNLVAPQFSLQEILDALELLRDELDMQIQGIQDGIDREAQHAEAEADLEDEAYVAACIDGDAAEQWMHERGGYEYQESERGVQ